MSSIILSRKRTMSTAFGSGDGEDNGTVCPYDVESETPPSEPFYSLNFQSAVDKGENIPKQLAEALKKSRLSPVDGDNLPGLIGDAEALSKFEASDTRTIAILGDSGEGKSSLINSLLNIPDIAKTGDMGAACTSVVTEYRLKKSDHKARITIEAEYLSTSEIEDLVKEVLWSYRRKHLLVAQDDEISDSEHAKLKRESDEAWSSLEAAFTHHEGFSKEWLTNDMSEEGLAIVTDQIIQWAQEIEWPAGADSGRWTSTADTADECCEKTSIFMQDQFWPFTKIIRVYVEAKVLKAGIILADLPGLHDTNLARVKATQDYLLRCDHIFVVTKISRAITNQSVKSSLTSVVSNHAELEWDKTGGKGMKIAIICTNSEDINEKTARRDSCGPNKRIPDEEMAKLDRAIEKAKANKNRSLAKKLKLRQRWLLIEARNEHVKEELKRVYEPEIGEGALEIFCVSNTSYEKYAKKGNPELVIASGIPKVRRFCQTITAHSLELQAINYILAKLSGLLNSSELRAAKAVAQPLEATLDKKIFPIVRNVQAEVFTAVSQYRTSFLDEFRNVILTYLENLIDVWETSAKDKSSKWYSWKRNQFSAWCRNDGIHKTKRRAKTNWNGELIWKMRMETELQWDMLQDETTKLLADLLQSIKEPLLRLQSEMREKSFGPLLVGGIDFRLREIEYTYNLEAKNFAKELNVVRYKATQPNQSSYVASEMIPTYRSAAQEHGRGSERRRHNIVQERITNGTLFPNISIAIKEDVEAKAEAAFSSFRSALLPTFARIKNDISVAIAAEMKSLDKAYEERKNEERRRKELASTIQVLKRQHRELLGRIAYNQS